MRDEVLETRVETHTCAPESRSSSQDSGKTSVAITGYPCFSKFLAMGVPMLPIPMKPTGVLEAIDLQDTKKTHKHTYVCNKCLKKFCVYMRNVMSRCCSII